MSTGPAPASTTSSPSQKAHHILLLNGPNLNLLGTREPHLYGTTTLPDVVARAAALAASLSATLSAFQSNHEGFLIDRIHAARLDGTTAIVINPGGLAHTSVALRDALAALAPAVPFVEVHVTNVHAREPFRHSSYLSGSAVAVVCGLGVFGYSVAVEFCVRHLDGGVRRAGA